MAKMILATETINDGSDVQPHNCGHFCSIEATLVEPVSDAVNDIHRAHQKSIPLQSLANYPLTV